MIFNVPIESIEERYSKQWNKWFPRFFESQNISYETIYPKHLESTILTGRFLNIVTSNNFKAKQLVEITELFNLGLIHNGDVFLFHDLWFPGLEMLAYIRNCTGIKFGITGILHAGTYDLHDFLYEMKMESWGKHLENSWFAFADKIFVATMFHKGLIRKSRKVSDEKIVVTGLPLYDEFSILGSLRDKTIVFPHRLDPEKQPELFDKLKEEPLLKTYNFVKTKDGFITKEGYYKQLNSGKVAVSFALQETWGIAMQESVLCGCLPVVPRRLSYEELYPNQFKYSTYKEAVSLIANMSKNYNSYDKLLKETQQKIIKNGANAIPNIVTELRKDYTI